MSNEEREYLDGWTYGAKAYHLWTLRGAVSLFRDVAPGWNPFTPYGAGQADAVLVAMGLDA